MGAPPRLSIPDNGPSPSSVASSNPVSIFGSPLHSHGHPMDPRNSANADPSSLEGDLLSPRDGKWRKSNRVEGVVIKSPRNSTGSMVKVQNSDFTRPTSISIDSASAKNYARGLSLNLDNVDEQRHALPPASPRGENRVMQQTFETICSRITDFLYV